MNVSQVSLFRDSRFLPLFICQFCGCFNDCLMKNALIILVSYKIVDELPISAALLVLLANGLFVASSVFFGGIAGQLADKYERSTLVKVIKLAEIGIVVLSCHGFWTTNLMTLYLAIMLMGIHSTFFGPLKYSILPDHLPKDKLLSANGLIEAGTFVGILIGSLTGGLYTYAPIFVTVVMIIVTVIGFISSLFIPSSNNYNPELIINKDFLRENANIIRYCRSKKVLFLSILGVSWFWFIGASFLSQIPILTKVTLGANEGVTNLFLVVFSIGVGFGSFWCGRLLNGEISTKYVFLSAIGMSLFSLDLYFSAKLSSIYVIVDGLIDVPIFLSYSHHWRILFDLFCISSISGIYVVPLYAVMQVFSPITHRSRVIAANNIINGLFMVVSAVMLSILFAVKFTIPQVILILCCMNLFVAWYIYKLTPDPEIIPTALVKAIFRFLFVKLYKVEVHGLENFHNAGKRVVIIANHISYIDPPLIASFLPDNTVFAINTQVAQRSWVRPFLRFAKTYPIDPSNAMGMKHLIRELRANKKIVIFPEGGISLTGALMKVYEGPGAIADKANAVILPVRINGAEYTPFSKLKKLVNIKWFPKITITILPAIKFNVEEESDVRTRRKIISQRLYDIMSEMMFETSGYKTTIFHSIIDAAKIQGPNYKVLDDISNTELTYRQLFQRCFILGELLSKKHRPEEVVGIMMPNASGTVIAFLAMQAYGIVPAMINFTSGARNILAGCDTASVKTIYTSKQFVHKAELTSLVQELSKVVNIVYLENLRSSVKISNKIRGLVAGLFPNLYYNYICLNHNPHQICISLFLSGHHDVAIE